ncbi:MAG: myo-inosose-2 dehydratase [Alphaproteobacteria bacterium]|nr:myo-inosose-2 dehydratase [Alphaproteobacteria bacterium]
MVRLGINPLTWTNDDMPELGADTPLETCLGEARQAGFTGIELGNKFPRRPEQLRLILERHGLALVSGWYSARLSERSVADEIDALTDHLTLLKALGCRVMVFAEVTGCVHGERSTPVSRRPTLSDGQWRRLATGMNDVGRYLRTHGVHLAYHHHMGTVIETETEIDRLMAMTGPDVGLLLDTGHLTYAGGNPVALARRHAGRIVHVHCKDVRGEVLKDVRSRDSSFLDSVLAGVFTVPGDGIVDYRAVLAPIAATGYDGWLVVEAEQDPAKADPLTYATLGCRNLQSFATAAGLTIAGE